MKTATKRQSGFTFIELLVVMTIIAVITGVAVVSYNATALKSRDARRKTDIESIRSALELCRTESGSYPASIYNNMSCSGEVYLLNTPRDPKTNAPYLYTMTSATTYTLSCTLESGDSCSFQNP